MIALKFAIGSVAIIFGVVGLGVVADGHTARWWRRLVVLHQRRRAKVRRLIYGPPRCGVRPGCEGSPAFVVILHSGSTVPACAPCSADRRAVDTVLWNIADHIRLPKAGEAR